jgi:6-phosphogluconolactonase
MAIEADMTIIDFRKSGLKMEAKQLRLFNLGVLAILIGVTCLISGLLFATDRSSSQYLAYVGTYTGPNSKGIYGLRFDANNGKVDQLGVVAEVANPSFLTLDRNQRYLYAVSELRGNTNGLVSSFAINKKTGMLTFLNKVSTIGTVACHLVVDKTNKMLLVANYGSGSVAAFRVKADGSLSESTDFSQHSGSSVNPRRQRGPHAHAVVLSADNRFLFVPDLGLDEIKSYRLDPEQAKFGANEPPYVKVTAGFGPRHFAFHPNNKYAYDVNEMGSSVTAFSYDAQKGVLHEIQNISTLPEGFTGVNNSAEIQIDKAGRFLYASNRGHDSIATFSISRKDGKLTKIQTMSTQGKTPRNFALDPTGKYLLAANQDSDTVVVFRVDQKSGRLSATGQTVSVPSPVCIEFTPAS